MALTFRQFGITEVPENIEVKANNVYNSLVQQGKIPVGKLAWYTLNYASYYHDGTGHPCAYPYTTSRIYDTIESAVEGINYLIQKYPNYHELNLKYETKEKLMDNIRKNHHCFN